MKLKIAKDDGSGTKGRFEHLDKLYDIITDQNKKVRDLKSINKKNNIIFAIIIVIQLSLSISAFIYKDEVLKIAEEVIKCL